MLFKSINITKELTKTQHSQEDLLLEIKELLSTAKENDQQVLQQLKQGSAPFKAPNLALENLDTNRIFTIDTINQLCVKYRLRFLDSKHFKAEYPYEAILQINEFERKHQVKIEHFKIIAPYSMFQLKDVNEDPLLFAQLSDKHFYLLHQWGKELNWYRGILNYPFQSIYTFFLSILMLALLLAWSPPFGWLNTTPGTEIQYRFWLSSYFTISFFFFALFLGSLSNASFSDSVWNSKYYNQ